MTTTRLVRGRTSSTIACMRRELVWGVRGLNEILGVVTAWKTQAHNACMDGDVLLVIFWEFVQLCYDGRLQQLAAIKSVTFQNSKPPFKFHHVWLSPPASQLQLRRAAARSALLRLPFAQPSAPYNKPPKNESHSHGGGSSNGYPAPAYASPFASLVPSAFPPRTDLNVVACFQMHERTFKLLENSATLSHIIKIKIKSLQQTNLT
ncbi:hypothetical protein JHK82_021307 [Glycine max]|nr:hypothetical protein JHK82_021307 [Glycine max]